MEESPLSSCLTTIEKDCRNLSNSSNEDTLLCSKSLAGGDMNVSGTKRKIDSAASPLKTMTSPVKTMTSPLSPFRSPSSSCSKMPVTPSSPAMTTTNWLHTTISPLPSRPSLELELFLSKCDRDVTDDVINRVHIILEAIFPNTGVGERRNTMDNIWAKQRRLEVTKLYYRVLEAMCRAESQILHGGNLTPLLTNERFHRCMLACSAELILATHKTATMLFPAVLERTGITAFDLSKVIESFIRHEESLPRELRRHLNSLEEKLLESMVWEKGSSMYNSLIVARSAYAADINRLGLLAEPMPSLDSIAMHVNITSGGLPPVPSFPKDEAFPGQNGDFQSPKKVSTEFRSGLVDRSSFTSPAKDRLLAFNNLKSKLQSPALQSAFASPTKPIPGGGGETCAETAINVFFGKIVKLAAVRINAMVEKMQLSRQIREHVYSLFRQILTQRTSLFFNRHIDQIILCCFYGVAKISQLGLTFKEIIGNYRKQPQFKTEVFRSVFVDWSSVRGSGKTRHDHVDIITFYNEIFLPAVKTLLGEPAPTGTTPKTNRVSDASNNNEGECPGSPEVVSPFPSLPDMSPRKVSTVHNVYVSPLRSSKMDALISHSSSKSYYACVGESTHAFQSPSKDLTAINNRLNSTRKVKGMLNFDDVKVGLVSDSLVANSLYLQSGTSAASPFKRVKSEQLDS